MQQPSLTRTMKNPKFLSLMKQLNIFSPSFYTRILKAGVKGVWKELRTTPKFIDSGLRMINSMVGSTKNWIEVTNSNIETFRFHTRAPLMIFVALTSGNQLVPVISGSNLISIWITWVYGYVKLSGFFKGRPTHEFNKCFCIFCWYTCSWYDD